LSLVLSTILLAILLLPGLFFRKFYYSEEFSKEYFRQSFSETVLSAFFPSLVLHFLWYFIIQIFGYKIDIQVIGSLIFFNPNNTVFENISSNAFNILLYNISIIFAGSILGYFTKKAVRALKLDRRQKLFRFQNSWHYILKGEFFEFPRAAFDLETNSVEEIEFVFIDALVSTPEGTIIYDGVLVDYELTNDGGLDFISLKGVQRRFLKDDFKKEGLNVDNYYKIPGHILIIKYSEILNLNFSYYKLEFNKNNELIPVLVS
jgi:hypothetical protein